MHMGLYLVFRKLSVMHILVPVLLHTALCAGGKGLTRS